MEHQQKTLSSLTDFERYGGGDQGESVKKEKFVTKIFFLNNVD